MDAPIFTPLTDIQVAAIYAALGRAAEWAGVDSSPSTEAIQEIYDAFLEQDIRDDDRLLTLGIAFGQLLVNRGGLEWVGVKDQRGEEVCVGVPGLKCFCAPISMIGKRIGRAESLNVEQLCTATLELLAAKSGSPDVGRR